eukprot:s5039_g3.t1
MVRIDYSDTHAFTHRIEQEKAAKALFASRRGEMVALTDQPQRWLRQTMRQFPVQAEASAAEPAESTAPPSELMGPEGLLQASQIDGRADKRAKCLSCSHTPMN